MTDRRYARFFLEEYTDVLKQSAAFFAFRLRKYLLSFTLIILLASAAGVAYWYNKTPIYESSLVCGYNNERFSRKNFGEIVQKLDLLAQTRSKNELAALLHLSPEQAAKIVSIEAKNRSGSLLHEDITGDYQPLYFTLKATDRAVFAPFQASLVAYVSNMSYLQEIGAIQIARLTRKIDFLKGDLAKVDSLIDAYTVAVRNSAVLDDTVASRFGITAILNYKDQLEEKLTSLEQQKSLESGASLIVMHGFAPTDRPTRGSKKPILAFAIIGFMAATCWIVLRDNKQPSHA